MEQEGVSVTGRSQPKGLKPKTRGRKLRSGVEWQRALKQKKRKTRAKSVYLIMTYTAQCNVKTSLPDDDSDGSKQLKVQNSAMLADIRVLTPAHRSVVSATVAQCSTTTRDYGGEKRAVVDWGGMRQKGQAR
jgi:hypothetical protein